MYNYVLTEHTSLCGLALLYLPACSSLYLSRFQCQSPSEALDYHLCSPPLFPFFGSSLPLDFPSKYHLIFLPCYHIQIAP